MLSEKNIVIVGGGIAGFSAGIYAEQNGFHAIILEKHNIPGGLCTGWYRKGFYIDGCTHWLNGTKKGSELYNNWVNLGCFHDENDIIFQSNWGSFDYFGKKIVFWSDLEKAEKEWIEISPEDEKRIHRFFKYVKFYSSFELPLQKPATKLPFKILLSFVLDIIPHPFKFFLPIFWNKQRYISKFKSKALRKALNDVQQVPSNVWTLFYSYGSIASGNGGIPRGGSLKMMKNVEQRFLDLGGTVRYNAPVKSIIIKNQKAVGVLLESGQEINCDYVVTACDYNHVLTSLLDNKYVYDSFDRRYFNKERYIAPSCVLIHYAIEDMPNINYSYSFQCEPFMLGNMSIDHLQLRCFSFDPETFVKGNKVVVQVLLDQLTSNYDEYWANLYKNKHQYSIKKAQIAKLVEDKIIKQFPELKGKITTLDVATPCKFKRYTNSSRGAFMSYVFTERNMNQNLRGKVPGIKNLYMAGQWAISPGGLPLASSSGKFAIQRICKQEKISFVFASFKKVINL